MLTHEWQRAVGSPHFCWKLTEIKFSPIQRAEGFSRVEIQVNACDITSAEISGILGAGTAEYRVVSLPLDKKFPVITMVPPGSGMPTRHSDIPITSPTKAYAEAPGPER